ncbi:MAG: thiamine biosynthesis lipoprotein, partial [Oceanicoccus sp.]
MLTAFSSHRPAVFLCLLLLSYCSSTCADWFNASEDIMGTRISVELWQQDPQLAEQAMAEVMTLMQGVNATMSPYLESSELFQLNQQAAQQPVKVSAELFSLLQKAQYFSIISDGAFDISYASVGRFYNYLSGHAASNADLEKNLSAIDYRLIKLDAEDRSVYFQHPQLAIDLGGIAKGYAVDLAIAALRKRSIASAIVSAGGDSRILGDRQGHPWVMGIRHPRQPDEYAV